MISCILLTAGESQRFGAPKALARINSLNTIELLQQNLIDSIVDDIVIVTGAHATMIEPYVFNHSKVRLVYNKYYKIGQTSSIKTGLNIVYPKTSGFLLLPIDCPFIKKETINELILTFTKNDPKILIPTYQKKRGHPPLISTKLNNEILNLPMEKGLNNLISLHHVQELEINDPGIVRSFNTPEELAEILRLI